LGVLFSADYNSLSFSENILSLNADFPSLGGNVDIDWMLRSAAGGLGYVDGLSHATYWSGKMVWNVARIKNPFENISQDGNANAPNAARMWLQEGMKLDEIFAPAIKKCECIK
jgi:hypothetical protein